MKNPPYKILLLVKGGANRALISDYINELGFECLLPGEGESVSLMGRDADLILIDSSLPESIHRKVLLTKKTVEDAFLPVIVMVKDRKIPQKWIEMGYDDFIVMPFRKAELKLRMETLLRIRKQTELLLRKTESVYQALIESSTDHIFVLDRAGRVVLTNENVKHLGFQYGWELIGREIDDLFSGETLKLYRDSLEAVLVRGGKQSFFHTLDVGGERRYHHDTLYPIKMPDGLTCVGVTCVDITERMEAKQWAFLLARAVEGVEEVVFITDSDGIIQYVNPAFTRVTGYSPDEVIGESPRLLKSGVHERDFYRGIIETVRSGRTWAGEMTNRKKDGSLYDVYVTVSPITDESGKITHFISIQRDITEEKKAQRRLEQAQRLEALGTLAGGIAHDFNNILTPIVGYSEILSEALQDDPVAHDKITKIKQSAMRAQDMVRQILTFSRKREKELVRFSPQSVLKEFLKVIRETFPANIEIKQDISPSVPDVMGDPTEFHQVILNLSVNALHAMEGADTGVLKVTLEPYRVSGEENAVSSEIPPGDYVRLSVEDTGEGIPGDVIDRIFDPFFTTKQEGKGTGLGLSVVHGIVRGWSGHIKVYSEVGRGTRFDILIPVASSEEKDITSEEDVTEELPAGEGETVLIAEDEETVRELCREVLETLNYRVLVAPDGEKALQVFKERGDEIDLVISDTEMPGKPGDLLAREILALRPGMPIILTSGFSERFNEEKLREIGVKGFVLKPFNIKTLATKIKEVLGKRQE